MNHRAVCRVSLPIVVAVVLCADLRADELRLLDGRAISGRVLAEDADTLTLATPDGRLVLDKAAIRTRTAAPHRTANPADPDYRYTMQIRAIRSTYLDGRHRDDGRKLQRGRDRLMKITDPAAIAPAVQLLADGNVPTRLLLVEWLGRFDLSAATDHLLHLAMHDEDPDVQAAAADQLRARRSPELVDQLIAGLRSDDDQVVRNSAGVLGLFRERRAAGPLVAALITRRTVTFPIYPGWVANVTQQAYISGLNAVVAEGVGQVEPIISTLNTGTVLDIREGFGTLVTETITIYRTEVQDALINITGQNFGFDQERWRTWLACNPTPASDVLPSLAPLPRFP